MGGYDQHPDYGGQPDTWRSWVGPAAVYIVMLAIVGYLLWG